MQITLNIYKFIYKFLRRESQQADQPNRIAPKHDRDKNAKGRVDPSIALGNIGGAGRLSTLARGNRSMDCRTP